MHSSKRFGPRQSVLGPSPSLRSSAAVLYGPGLLISSLLVLESCSRPAPAVATVSVNTQQLGAQYKGIFAAASDDRIWTTEQAAGDDLRHLLTTLKQLILNDLMRSWAFFSRSCIV